MLGTGERITQESFDTALCHGCHRFQCVCEEAWWQDYIARPEWQEAFGAQGFFRCPIQYPEELLCAHSNQKAGND